MSPDLKLIVEKPSDLKQLEPFVLFRNISKFIFIINNYDSGKGRQVYILCGAEEEVGVNSQRETPV